MNKAILIVGLPGSGKTYLAETKYVSLGYTLIDDPKSFFDILSTLSSGKDVVITDVHLCNELNRKAAELCFKNYNYEIEWVFFEDNKNKCRKLLELRNDNRLIKTFESFKYTIPERIIPLKIYEK